MAAVEPDVEMGLVENKAPTSPGTRATGASATQRTSTGSQSSAPPKERVNRVYSADKLFWYAAIGLGVIGVMLYAADSSVSVLIWDIIFLISSLVAAMLTWNYAYMVALGSSAEDLRRVVLKLDKENKVLRQNIRNMNDENDRLRSSNERIAQSSKRFERALSILGDSIQGEDGLGAINDKYSEILRKSRAMIRDRVKIAKQEAKLKFDQELAHQRRIAELIKDYGRDIFAEADKDNSRTITRDELPLLQRKFKEQLNITIDFSQDLEGDGEVTRVEMIDRLRTKADAVLNVKREQLRAAYERELAHIRDTFEKEGVDPLSDAVVAAMGADVKSITPRRSKTPTPSASKPETKAPMNVALQPGSPEAVDL